MITSPDGSGVRFTVNGAELTVMGSASIKAVKNGEMEVSVYDGSAKIVANGQEQYFGAGQSSSVQLGGENGTDAISAPSEPEPLTGDELTMACTMTGEFCTPEEIEYVSQEQAQSEIQSAITSTPTVVPTQTITRTPSPTLPATYTLVVLPSSTPSPKPTLTATLTRPGPTRTPGPTSTFTRTYTPSRTNTPTATNTPTVILPSTSTFTFTPTNTTVPTVTPISPPEPICGSVSLSALTNPNPNELSMDITNNNGSDITINRFFAYWIKSPNSQKIARLFLNGAVIWNTSDPNSPSDIPTEGNWANNADLTILNATTETLLIEFPNDLQPSGYEVHIVFDVPCQVIGNK